MQPIDHYEYWNKKRIRTNPILDREKKSLDFIKTIAKEDARIVDLACGDGNFLTYVRKILPNSDLMGIDFSKAEVAEVRKKGFTAAQGNFEDKIGLKSGSVDIVNAAEIIEHLYNPDNFLTEINRILKKNGYLVLSTPNLCAWFNRFFMLFGVQPLFLEMSTRSKLVGSGILKRMKKESHPVGHVRIFTLEALKDILHMYNFEIIKVRGSTYEEGLPKNLLSLDSLLTNFIGLSSNFVLLARKKS